MKFCLFLLLICFASCSLFDGMRKNSFEYSGGRTMSLVVPKGFKNVELKTDSAGNKTRLFTYSNGGSLYFYFGDTAKEIQPIDTLMHIAKYYPQGVLFYKGQDNNNGLFWRESRYNKFRFGYSNISSEREALFDSSLNNAAWQINQQ